MNKKIKDFLKPTRYCDSDNPIILEQANFITTPYHSIREKAVALFEWVRDNINYKFGYWGKKASQVLKEKEGMCTNKANLLIALLRAAKIPAGYGILKVNGKEYLGKLTLPVFKKNIASESVHVYVWVFLNNRWYKCDPSNDQELSYQIGEIVPEAALVSWDGMSSKLDRIKSEYIYDDIGPLSDIDKYLDKKPRHAKGINLNLGNYYLLFLRENGRLIKNKNDPLSETEKWFIRWLFRKHFIYCLIYLFLKFSI